MFLAVFIDDIHKNRAVFVIFYRPDTMNVKQTFTGSWEKGCHFDQRLIWENDIGRNTGFIGKFLSPLSQLFKENVVMFVLILLLFSFCQGNALLREFQKRVLSP